MIAICGLAISGIPYVAVLGYMAAIVVVVMMLAAITLLPALIGAVGKRIDRWRVPSLIHHRDGAGAAPERRLWARWARRVARHRWPFAIVGISILLMLAWPVLCMRLGESDDGNLATSTTQRQAYDLIAEGFGPGTNGPLLVVVALPSRATPSCSRHLGRAHEDARRRRGAAARRSSPDTSGSRSR